MMDNPFPFLFVQGFVASAERQQPDQQAGDDTHVQTADGQDVHGAGGGKSGACVGVQMTSVSQQQRFQHTAFPQVKTREQSLYPVPQQTHPWHQAPQVVVSDIQQPAAKDDTAADQTLQLQVMAVIEAVLVVGCRAGDSRSNQQAVTGIRYAEQAVFLYVEHGLFPVLESDKHLPGLGAFSRRLRDLNAIDRGYIAGLVPRALLQGAGGVPDSEAEEKNQCGTAPEHLAPARKERADQQEQHDERGADGQGGEDRNQVVKRKQNARGKSHEHSCKGIFANPLKHS